jgi:hypothetical protein
MTYPGFEPGTFGLVVSIANHYIIKVAFAKHASVKFYAIFGLRKLRISTNLNYMTNKLDLNKSFRKNQLSRSELFYIAAIFDR